MPLLRNDDDVDNYWNELVTQLSFIKSIQISGNIQLLHQPVLMKESRINRI